MKYITILLLVFVAGCVSNTTTPNEIIKFVCPDGKIVYTSSDCNAENINVTKNLIPEKMWIIVKNFTESGSKIGISSEPFHISGDRFRTNWKFSQAGSFFSYYIYTVEGNNLISMISTTNNSGESYIYHGGQDYYVTFNIPDAGKWSIIFENYI